MLTEMLERLLHVHLEDVVNVPVFEANLQRLAIEPASIAHRAFHPDVSEEIHLQAVGAVALARLAAPAGLVETKASRFVPANLRPG